MRFGAVTTYSKTPVPHVDESNKRGITIGEMFTYYIKIL